jgi:UDP-N-acetylglucosamine diphosphorylase/glucosamine-1-phosphate N-acetyltransferase
LPSEFAAIVLAAGKGKRMKSDKAKVLHTLLGRPMILYVLKMAFDAVGSNIVLVTGHQGDEVRRIASQQFTIAFAEQPQQLGTGHAVNCAMPQLADHVKQVVILYGDVPLLSVQTLNTLMANHSTKNRDISLLAVDLDNPTGYGRILHDHKKRFAGIVEEADASATQKEIKTINTGICCVRREFLEMALDQIRPDNKQGEYYLTDITTIGYRQGFNIGLEIGDDPLETLGVNTIQELRRVEGMLKNQKRITS